MVSSILWDRRRNERRSHSVSINASDSARIPRAALREAYQQTRVTHDDGKSTQHEWPGNPEPAECRRACSNSHEIALRLLPDRHHGIMDVLAWNGAFSCDGVLRRNSHGG
jgi:hypothetical protein